MKQHYAVLAGMCASAASLFGKFSGNGLAQEFLLVRVIFLVLMVVCNLNVWTLFVKACQSSDSSLKPTVISSTTNFLMSGLAGYLLFGEVISTLWWTGTGFLIIGLLLLISDGESNVKTDKNKIK